MTLFNSPVSGWYSDPTSPSNQRYWDGEAWTDHVRPEMPAPHGAPTFQGLGGMSPRNRVASWALGLSIGSLMVNFFAILPATSLILGIVGLTRSGRMRQMTGVAIGKASSIWAICLSGLGIVLFFAFVLPALFSASTPTFDKAGTEQEIIEQAAAKGITYSTVECPTTPSIREGNTFQCIASVSDGTTLSLNIRIQDNQGSYTWDSNPFK